MKIAVNKCYGGFSLSRAVYKELGIKWDGYGYLYNENFDIPNGEYHLAYRAHPKLIAAIEKVGEKKASTRFSEIRIIDIPVDVEWEIDEYDGIETIHEVHRRW